MRVRGCSPAGAWRSFAPDGCRGRTGSPRGAYPTLCLALLLALLASCQHSPREDEGSRAAERAPRQATSWRLPQVDPCAILSRTAVEALVGSPVGDPRPGGTAVDGSACQYVGTGPFVVTLGFMSTNAYESLKVDFGGEPVSGTGLSALVDGPDQLGDVIFVARSLNAAVLVQISGVIPGAAGTARQHLAAEIARRALDRLKHSTIALHPNVSSRRARARYIFRGSGETITLLIAASPRATSKRFRL